MIDQAGQDTSDWLSIAGAATAYDVSQKTIRRRIKARTLAAVQVAGHTGAEWRVEPPGRTGGHVYPGQDIDQDIDQGAPGRPQTPRGGQSSALIPLDQLETLLAPLAVERDRLALQVEQLQGARLEDAKVAAEQIGRLRGLLEAAQGEIERLRAAPPVEAPLVQPVEVQAPRKGWRWPWGKKMRQDQ